MIEGLEIAIGIIDLKIETCKEATASLNSIDTTLYGENKIKNLKEIKESLNRFIDAYKIENKGDNIWINKI